MQPSTASGAGRQKGRGQSRSELAPGTPWASPAERAARAAGPRGGAGGGGAGLPPRRGPRGGAFRGCRISACWENTWTLVTGRGQRPQEESGGRFRQPRGRREEEPVTRGRGGHRPWAAEGARRAAGAGGSETRHHGVLRRLAGQRGRPGLRRGGAGAAAGGGAAQCDQRARADPHSGGLQGYPGGRRGGRLWGTRFARGSDPGERFHAG